MGRFTVREFHYNKQKFDDLVKQRGLVDAEVAKAMVDVRTMAKAFWSDLMVAWMHVKAIRLFVESVLRHGLPPRFMSYCFAPRRSQEDAVRKVLNDLYIDEDPRAAQMASKEAGDEEFDGEDYYPYVCLSFMPFAVNSED